MHLTLILRGLGFFSARRGVHCASVLLALLLCSRAASAQTPNGSSPQTPNDSGTVTLQQFRAQVESRGNQGTAKPKAKTSGSDSRTPEVRKPDAGVTDRVFLQLLTAQAKSAAAHQSVDRLSGWRKAIETRFETQNAPELDVQTIQFAEARRVAESARYEAERKRAAAQANSMMGRPADASIMAALPAAAGDPPSVGEKPPQDKQPKDLLAQGEELVTKMYKSYQFGGITLTALLWQEQELYRTEAEYRVEIAAESVTAAPEEAR